MIDNRPKKKHTKGTSWEDSRMCAGSEWNRGRQCIWGKGNVSGWTCLVRSAAARLSDPCQVRFVPLTKSGTFSWQEVRCFSTPCMLCRLYLCPLSLPLSLSCWTRLWCLYFLSLPIRSCSVSVECAYRACTLHRQGTARQCVQKVKLDQRFGRGLVKDGECIRFPGLILPCPTFHYPSFWLDFKGLGQRTLQCHLCPYHKTTSDHMHLLFLALRYATLRGFK